MPAAEHVFEIHAPAEHIWRALREEADQGVDAGHVVVLVDERPRRLALDVAMGWGMTVHYAYEVRRAGGGSEVTVAITPRGLRWALSNIFMLGRGVSPFALAAAQGLANLKDTLEREQDGAL